MHVMSCCKLVHHLNLNPRRPLRAWLDLALLDDTTRAVHRGWHQEWSKIVIHDLEDDVQPARLAIINHHSASGARQQFLSQELVRFPRV